MGVSLDEPKGSGGKSGASSSSAAPALPKKEIKSLAEFRAHGVTIGEQLATLAAVSVPNYAAMVEELLKKLMGPLAADGAAKVSLAAKRTADEKAQQEKEKAQGGPKKKAAKKKGEIGHVGSAADWDDGRDVALDDDRFAGEYDDFM
jgi:hypothetical protein